MIEVYEGKPGDGMKLSRREYLAAAKRRQRQREKSRGDEVITVTLSAEEAQVFKRAQELQRGPVDVFAKRCLTQGAMFLANMGTPRGRKLRALLTCQQLPLEAEGAEA